MTGDGTFVQVAAAGPLTSETTMGTTGLGPELAQSTGGSAETCRQVGSGRAKMISCDSVEIDHLIVVIIEVEKSPPAIFNART